MINEPSYSHEQHSVTLDGKEYSVKNDTPIFTEPERREELKRKIEDTLYQIFQRYTA